MQDELDDFFLDGGDELMNTEPCPHCGRAIRLDLDKVDQSQEKRYKCPHCGEEVVIE